jgi:hypothetical protein
MVGFLVFIWAVQRAVSMLMCIGAVVTVGTMV